MKTTLKTSLISYFILIILNSITHSSSAQFRSGKLSFEIKYIQNYTWKDKLSECYANDSLKLNERADEIEVFLNKHNTKDSVNKADNKFVWSYQFDSVQARITGNQMFNIETFDLYYFSKLTRIIRIHHKGNPNDLRIDTMDYRKVKSNRNYSVRINRDSIRLFKGYSCYQILVKETKDSYRSEMITHYELYVTEDIKFSPSVILDWGEHLTEDCPVYVKSWINNEIRNYTEYSLLSFEEELDKTAFLIPEKFKNFYPSNSTN